VLEGYSFENLTKIMLEKSGYTVCPYGTRVLRVRSSPDLLVYDNQNLMLVKVKSRSSSPPYIGAGEIEPLREFWSDSILVVAIPEGNVFYAQRISELEIRQNDFYPLSDFEKLQDIFTRVGDEDISHYSNIALQNLKTKKGSDINE